jgi:NADPH-dependent 2,4-dienoyl-CoA reductase/sulfur reductase-like enzyme
MVVGGGPGGMKAAAVAAERGHQVTLYERGSQLGGQVLLAQLLPRRAEFGRIAENLAREMAIAGVSVQRNTDVTAEFVARHAPDALILATGAGPRAPEIEGGEDAHVVDAWQVVRGEANVGARVVVADWRCDWIGLGVAEKLARDGCAVTLAVNGYMAGQMLQIYMRDPWVGTLHSLGVEVVPYARLFGADGDTVYLQHTASGEPIVLDGIDTLVTAHAHKADTALGESLAGWEGEVHRVGDCLAPRTCEEAVLEGLEAGLAV